MFQTTLNAPVKVKFLCLFISMFIWPLLWISAKDVDDDIDPVLVIVSILPVVLEIPVPPVIAPLFVRLVIALLAPSFSIAMPSGDMIAPEFVSLEIVPLFKMAASAEASISP